MKHVIIGTAGHIDHGKTSLIKAITGQETDRLDEEKERGISIELGFTYFDLPSKQRAGIIDVPGHERFVRNMLAGVVGLDIVLFVVAADEGMMPQSKEHLAILDLLGVEKGIIVMTKSDLVDDEWKDLIEEELREEVKGSFLEDSPIIRVSSKDKSGIDKLIEEIDNSLVDIKEKELTDMPRLPIDRSFVIKGFGTIVAGTLLSGVLNLEDEIRIYPGEKKARIRSIQIHGKDEKKAEPGQRVAINLAGIDKEDGDTGNIVAYDGSLQTTMMLDGKIKLLKSFDRPLKNRTRVRVYLATKEVLARIVILDREEILPGEEAYIQLRLEEKIVAKMKDRFIIRHYSPMYTIGGGVVLDSNPSKNSRFDKEIINNLKIRDKGDIKTNIENIIKSNIDKIISLDELQKYFNPVKEELLKYIDELIEEEKIVALTNQSQLYLIHIDLYRELEDKIINNLEEYHNKFPLRIGPNRDEFISKQFQWLADSIGNPFIEKMEKNGKIKKENHQIMLRNHKIEYKCNEAETIKRINDISIKNRFALINKKDLMEELDMKDDEYNFTEIFNSLIDSKQIIKIDSEYYILDKILNEAESILVDYLKENKEINVALYRDLLDTNRKISISLLEYFDEKKITRRLGDIRVLH